MVKRKVCVVPLTASECDRDAVKHSASGSLKTATVKNYPELPEPKHQESSAKTDKPCFS